MLEYLRGRKKKICPGDLENLEKEEAFKFHLERQELSGNECE